MQRSAVLHCTVVYKDGLGRGVVSWVLLFFSGLVWVGQAFVGCAMLICASLCFITLR